MIVVLRILMRVVVNLMSEGSGEGMIDDMSKGMGKR